MKYLNKLKLDRKELINNLCESIDALERIAFEQYAEIERLKAENEKLRMGMAGGENVL